MQSFCVSPLASVIRIQLEQFFVMIGLISHVVRELIFGLGLLSSPRSRKRFEDFIDSVRFPPSVTRLPPKVFHHYVNTLYIVSLTVI